MSERILPVNDTLSIPLAEIAIRATPSSGPGGQHVNRSSTRVEAVWNVAGSPVLTEAQRTRLLLRLASRLDGEGNLRVVASDHRSQLRNRTEALERLAGAVARALVMPKTRRATRPTRALVGPTLLISSRTPASAGELPIIA